jgi:hypothetical protein
MRLAVLVLGNVEELESTYPSANHDEESNKLDLLYVLFIGVLQIL